MTLVSCSGLWKKSVPGTVCRRVMATLSESSRSLPTLKSARRTSSVEPRRFGSGSRNSTFAGLMSRWQVSRTRCAYSTAVASGIMYSSTRKIRSRIG